MSHHQWRAIYSNYILFISVRSLSNTCVCVCVCRQLFAMSVKIWRNSVDRLTRPPAVNAIKSLATPSRQLLQVVWYVFVIATFWSELNVYFWNYLPQVFTVFSNGCRKEDVAIHSTLLFFSPCTSDEHVSVNEKRCGTRSAAGDAHTEVMNLVMDQLPV